MVILLRIGSWHVAAKTNFGNLVYFEKKGGDIMWNTFCIYLHGKLLLIRAHIYTNVD